MADTTVCAQCGKTADEHPILVTFRTFLGTDAYALCEIACLARFSTWLVESS
jgi:hypothetical protein